MVQLFIARKFEIMTLCFSKESCPLELTHKLTLFHMGFLRYCPIWGGVRANPPLVSQLLDPKNSKTQLFQTDKVISFHLSSWSASRVPFQVWPDAALWAKRLQNLHFRVNIPDFGFNGFNTSIWVLLSPLGPQKSLQVDRIIQIPKICG